MDALCRRLCNLSELSFVSHSFVQTNIVGLVQLFYCRLMKVSLSQLFLSS